uniref:Small-conductance mechanosensitive channel-like protein n=1 Tax=uncultured marine group II/III euryarchaeote KM3_46_H05 TaxID=1456450 RepID=A0A075HA94_9EURY|nr:small-conductance mechanosensitive channel-like protein [uncultured marine group II/III euryarchaeote KM3_46_H05]
MTLLDTATEYWAILDGYDWWIRFVIGVAASLFAGWLVQTIAKGPVLKLISKSDNKYDDTLFELATPLINAGVVLGGLWLTLVWAIEGDSSKSMILATLIVIILVYMIARFFAKTVEIFVPIGFESLNKRGGVDLGGIESLLLSGLKLVIWLGAAIVIFGQLNIDITGILASATVISLVVGMALKETASNLVSGMMMVMDKPFEVGDKITVMGVTGKVVDVGIMSTKIKTGQEHQVVIPNKSISGKEVINFAKGGPEDAPKRVNLRLNIGVGYDEEPAHVKQMILDVVRECDYIVDEPKPTALFRDMLDSALLFRVNCWVRDYADEWVARDWILTRVLERCIDEDIDIPYPHMQLKYDPASVVEEKAAKSAAEDEKRAADKERKKAEARVKDEAESAARMKERNEIRARIDELNQALEEDEPPEDEEGEEATEARETRMAILAEIQELEHKLDEGSGDDD